MSRLLILALLFPVFAFACEVQPLTIASVEQARGDYSTSFEAVQEDLHEALFLDDCVRESLDNGSLEQLVDDLLSQTLATTQLIESYLARSAKPL